MPDLIEPTVQLQASWLAAHTEWGPGLHEDGFGLSPGDDVESAAGFAAWVGLLRAEEEASGSEPAQGCLYRWIVEDGRVLGGIAARWGDNEHVRQNGHIGYGVVPSARRRGVGTWALGRVVDELAMRGVRRVLLVCEADNQASAATIERNGGRLERPATDASAHADRVLRYWINQP